MPYCVPVQPFLCLCKKRNYHARWGETGHKLGTNERWGFVFPVCMIMFRVPADCVKMSLVFVSVPLFKVSDVKILGKFQSPQQW